MLNPGRIRVFLFALCLVTGPGTALSFGQTPEAAPRQGRNELIVYYLTEDPNYRNTISFLPDLGATVERLRTQLAAQPPSQFVACRPLVATAIRRVADARVNEPVGQYGFMNALLSLSPTENSALIKLVKTCTSELGTTADPQIRQSIGEVDRVRVAMDEAFGQIDESAAEKRADAGLKRTAGSMLCPSVDFQAEGYTVRKSRIVDPFVFLPWVKARQERAGRLIASLLDSKPFRWDHVSGKALEIIEAENALGNSALVKLQVEIVQVENCSELQADVVYKVFTTQLQPVLSGTPEQRQAETEEVETATGQVAANVPQSPPLLFKPAADYDFSGHFSAGASFRLQPKSLWKLPFDALVLDAKGFSEKQEISGRLSGSHDSDGWLAQSQWQLSYDNRSLPTDAGNLKSASLSAHFIGSTKAFLKGNVIYRFGGGLEGGNRQSDMESNSLTANTVRNTGVGMLKFYSALAARLPRNVFSMSYGVSAGSVRQGNRVDWWKHVADLKHEFWYPLGDHRILEVESQFTAGRLQVPGSVPASERFFGGNNDQSFISGDTWQIRQNPVIRAIPGSRFRKTPGGAGGERFFSYNLTLAYAIWRSPLIPSELSDDPDFEDQLDGAMTTITNTLQNFHATKDPLFAKARGRLPDVETRLNTLKAAVENAQSAIPGQFEAEFKACARAVNTAIRRVKSVGEPGSDPYGNVAELAADDGSSSLAKASRSCDVLNAAIKVDEIASASAAVENLRQAMAADFNMINNEKAAASAEADMAFTKRTLNTLREDVNIYALSPVFVFDAAKIAAKRNGIGGVRYGPGVGVRFELATLAHFTFGYAWNVNHDRDEGRGNLFFSIGVRNLFQ